MEKSDINNNLRDLLATLEELKKQREILRTDIRAKHLKTTTRTLLKQAEENCRNETVLQWLREKSKSVTFSKLVEMFNFLKEKISEEEKKNHDDHVNVTFMAHGAIRDFMIPASCLLPLQTITDVVLYAPWNCITNGAAYGIATGKMKPEHRVFKCRKIECKIPDDKHQPLNLPNHWNSMKKAGDQMIPNITVSPLEADDGVWDHFKNLTEKHGDLGRNQIVIPFTPPGDKSDSVPFSVVTLALSLVLLSSRFKATVHLNTCLGDQSSGQKFDKDYLQRQYGYTVDDTVMTCSPDAYKTEAKPLLYYEKKNHLDDTSTAGCTLS